MAFSLAVLFVALAVATWTDVRSQRVYNGTTYPAMILCAVLRGWEEGREGLADAVVGFLACGGLMLVCYACLSLGGGDVKLAALIGTALGWIQGLSVLLWMFVLAGAVAATLIIWRVGAGNLISLVFRGKGPDPIAGDGPSAPRQSLDEQLRRPLFLAPAALVAVFVVTAPWTSQATRDVARYAAHADR